MVVKTGACWTGWTDKDISTSVSVVGGTIVYLNVGAGVFFTFFTFFIFSTGLTGLTEFMTELTEFMTVLSYILFSKDIIKPLKNVIDWFFFYRLEMVIIF